MIIIFVFTALIASIAGLAQDPPPFVNGIEAGAVGNAVNREDPTKEENPEANDRRKKAASGEDTAKEGQHDATRLGAALTAAGIPMLASPIIPVKVAGAALLAKAGLAFSQAAADKRVAKLNGDEKNRLSTSEDRTGPNFKSKEPGKVPALDPALEKMLSDRGVNPEEFEKQWSSGKLSDAGELSRAIGEQAEFSPEDLALGEVIADQKVSELVGEPPESRAEDTLSTNERVKFASDGIPMLENIPLAGNTKGNFEKLGEVSSDNVASTAVRTKSSPQQSSGASTSSEQPNIGSSFAINPNLLRMFKEDYETHPGLTNEALRNLGIAKTRLGDGIFRMASRAYQGFGKWRSRPRFAKQKVPGTFLP